MNGDEHIPYETEEDGGQELTALAPIEESSPLEYNVTFFNATLLNTSAIIGTGIFSTPSVILRAVGSLGMLFVLYLIAPFITWAGLMVYIEMASMCGHKRSGAEVVYLEEAYPRPRYLLSTTFALATALLTNACVNSTVFAKHILHALDVEVTPFNQRSLAVSMATCAIWVCLFSNKWALRANNVAAVFKIGILIFISATGAACMLGWTTAPHTNNLRNPFAGSTYEANPLATSLVKALYNYVGWNTVLGLMAEVKGRNPIRTVRRAGAASILIAAFLFITTLISFSLVLTKEEILGANEVLGALFFRKVYGDTAADRLFPLFIGFSIFGNIVSVSFYYTRTVREAGRQGFFPFATFWSRVGRFKTPYGPVLLKWIVSCSLIIIVPAQDIFAFLIDLTSYPASIFAFLVSCGVWVLRRRRAALGLPEHAYKAPNFIVGVYVIQSVALLVMPWIPPKGGWHGGDVSFFYAAYCVVAVLFLLLCGFYYWLRFYALPRWYRYELVEKTVSLPGGVKTVVLTKMFKNHMGGDEQPLLHEGRGVGYVD